MAILLLIEFATPALAKNFPAQKDVPLDKEWIIKCNQSVDPDSLVNQIAIWLQREDQSISRFDITPIVDSENPNQIIIKHSSPFLPNSGYRLIVNSGVKDIHGNTLSDSSILDFSTAMKGTISSISDITKTIYVGDQYSLPTTVEATMTDGTKEQVEVTWNPSTVDSSKIRVFNYEGTVQEYKNLVSLILTVNQPVNELPQKYDLRTFDRVTPIKNQGSTNACWAFAATSALESEIDSGKLILDPFHLYYNTGYDKIDGIGQYLTAVPYYAAWKGPVLEDSGSKVLIKQVQEVLYLKPGDIDLLKVNIYKYGAVGSTIGMTGDDRRYWNPQTFAQYQYDNNMVNHAITLVGWDDNFAKENFSHMPPTNGAFIVKNSWGNNWGDNGYFYVSYYDKSLGYGNDGNVTNIVFSKVENTGYFDNNYQYDELGNTSSWGSSETEMFANVFKINQGNNESLKAVSFYAIDENTNYEVFVVGKYIDEQSFDNMRKVASGSFDDAGYYTVELDNKIELESNQKLAVIVKITTPNSNSPVAIEIPNGIYNSTSKAISNPGESFVKINGKWFDFNTIKNNGNVCLKAFTTNAYDMPLERLEISQVELSINVGEKQQLTPIFTPQNTTNKNVVWLSSNMGVAIIDQAGMVKGLKDGETTINLRTIDGKFEAKCKVIVRTADTSEKLIADNDLERIIRAEINKTTGELTTEDLKRISYLNIGSENIVSLEGLQNLINLAGIYISKNNISDLSPLSKLTKLKQISVYNNPIKNIMPLKNLVNLTHLTIENGNVSNIDAVAGMNNLEHICFYGNNIQDINAIAGLTSLKLVDFVGNKIVDIGALENLTNVEKLYISANQISNIESLRNLVNLKELIIGINPIEDFSPVETYYHNLVNKDFELP